MNLRACLPFRMAAGLLLMLANTCMAATADEELDQFFREYLEASFALRPVDATFLGDHRYDRQMDDLSAEARQRWRTLARDTLRELGRRIDYRKLTRDGQIDFEILREELEGQLWLMENTRPFEEDPRVYNTYVGSAIHLLLTQSTLPHEANIVNAISRMKQVPRVLEQARANLKRPLLPHTDTAIRQNRGAIGFYETTLFELAGDTPEIGQLRAVAAEVVSALKRFQTFLEEDVRPRATEDWRLGRARFARKLELTLNAGLSAAEVLAEAEREFARVERDMYIIARQLWSRFETQPLPPDDEEGRRTTVARVLHAVAQNHGTPETLTDDVRKTVGELKEFITRRGILALPEPDRCEIIEMPEFERGNSTAYMNSPPPLDPKAKGYYAVSPPPSDWDADRVRSYLEEYNNYMLRILTIHEAYPGHYVQLEYANRNPSLIRKVLSSGVYVEGWAVYTEQTMLDEGYGEGDPALRLTQLKFYLRAVANAILDHRMHCTGMTDDEAMDLLVRRCFQSEGEARLKVIRAKQSSVQLSTYFVGRMAHYRLRQQMQRELGDRFNLGRYHEAVLAPGSVPVKYLPELVGKALGVDRSEGSRSRKTASAR